jgi:glutamate racemase
MTADIQREASRLPIGVFDSGLGGLTVVRAIREALPHEDILYLGDTARVPYGTRSPRTVMRYARGCADILVRRGIKLLVVACNTVSAVAIDMLRVELDIPVLGVIEPGARAAVRATRSHKVGVIGTAGTIASGAYPREVTAISSRAEVFGAPAPLLVPLVEEGWLEGEVPRLAIERYLTQLAQHDVDTLVLGCTHYPMLRGLIEQVARRVLGDGTSVVDSAEATAHELVGLIGSRVPAAPAESPGGLHLMVTDRPQLFASVAARFLGHDVDEVEVVDL